MKANRYLSLAALLALYALATVGTVPSAAAAKEEGKFHLVYLVSAIDLRPGSKAFVDPVFFTNGDQIKGFYDYCRAFVEEGASVAYLKPQEVADPIEPIQSYCANSPAGLMLEGSQYHTLNNAGVSVRLGSIAFERGVKDGTRSGYPVIPSTRPYPGITAVESVSGAPPTIQLDSDSKNRPRYFFLMSRNKALLERIVSVQRYSMVEMQALTKRARFYAEEVKGRERSQQSQLTDGQVHTRVDEQKRPAAFDARVMPVLLDVLVADLDEDNKPDAIVGVAANWGAALGPFRWQGSLFLFSKSGNSFSAGHGEGGSYEQQLLHGYAYGPRALVKVGGCNYLFSVSSYGALASFENQPHATKSCLPLVVEREVGQVP